MKLRSLLLSFFVLSCSSISCKKVETENAQFKINNKVSVIKRASISSDGLSNENGRLSFDSDESFAKLMELARQTGDANVITQKVAMVSGNSFKPISLNPPLPPNETNSNSGVITNLAQVTRPPREPYPTDIDTLVDDQFFAEVVNQNGEIKVGKAIYRITPQGTSIAVEKN